jgi:hypothetical protein
MTRAPHSDRAIDKNGDKDEELRQARLRAEQAEKELQIVRRTVEELRSEQPKGSERSTISGQSDTGGAAVGTEGSGDTIKQLRQDAMMAHLLDALEGGKDVGHYGRLVFTMVAHLFLPGEEVVAWLTKDRDFSEEAAQAMLRQVEGRGYNPPRRERILAWQSEQEFPIIPNTEDPDCGNVYRSLKFPQQIYEDIEEYQEKKAEVAS